MVTESITEYKGYKIKLRYKTFNGGAVKIFKEANGKWFTLRQENWSFVLPETGLQRMKNYIDKFPEKLEEKFNRLFQLKFPSQS